MDLNKIKLFIKDKPLLLKIVATILCYLIFGLGVWFSVSSCASLDVDKFNVNTDKVQVDVEGVKVHPKDVSLVNNRDDAFNLSEYIESSSIGLSPAEKLILLDSFGLNPNTYSILLNNYNLTTFNNHCIRLEDCL